ncbi:hypothetical protein K492DRAFT_209052 [Lichtheimia hyalospora FSU 10163]|nr:hypothetical protein K492DRAFT_209052 [Lichtheimia hyalospora FSU 10163]
MVYITGDDGIVRKYACNTCIKASGSTRCQHTDRALVEIKRKGRPISQCNSCRQLRRTKQLHIKCICADKNTDPLVDNTPTPPADDTSQPATPSSVITTTSIATTSTITSTITSSSSSSTISTPTSSAYGNNTTAPTTSKPESSSSSSLLRCVNCDRSPCFCISSKPESESYAASNSTNTSPTSAGPNTPDDIIEQHRIPPPVSSLILPPIRLPMPSSSTRTPLHTRKLGIPIHDPHDDIDSDTPIYKSEENNAPDRGAVLGSLSDTRHEDLMEELYGPFQLPPPKKRQRKVNELNSAR